MAIETMAGIISEYVTFAAGDYARARLRIEECALCDGDGVTFERDEDGYGLVTKCPKCTNVRRRVDAFNGAKLPARYHDRTFEDFERYLHSNPDNPRGNLVDVATKVYDKAVSFIPGDSGLLLVGAVGTGKTHLLSALIRHFTLEKGLVCRFIEFTHLLSDLREAYERREASAAIVEHLASVPVLAIDELGKGRKTDWQLSIIDELISKRYNRQLSTFFTSNFPLTRPSAGHGELIDTDTKSFRRSVSIESLGDRVGESLVSRLFEMTQVVPIRGVPDYRRGQR
jgi:DNA replication protein DnaC